MSKGPTPINLRLLAWYQLKWLSLFRLLQNGRAEQRVLQVQQSRPQLPKFYKHNDGRNCQLRERYNAQLREPKRWRTELSEVTFKAIASEPKTLDAILSARTHQQIRSAWKASAYLRSHPASYPPNSGVILRGIREGEKYRFPASDREASAEKRLVHFASALAGIECGKSAALGIEKLIHKLKKHGRNCPCAPCVLERQTRNEQMSDLEEKRFQNEMETNPPLGTFYITLPPREKQRRSKRRIPALTRIGGFVMEP